jgi:membrane-associated phospholipid phosphatase
MWNRAAAELADTHPASLVENARRYALLNVAMADAVIAVWNAKNTYNAWRPITAIQNAGIDGNADTIADPTWTPVLVTPAHQEYPSGHSGVSSAAVTALTSIFGDDTPVSMTSDGLPGVTRLYANLAATTPEIALARIAAGIHFRFACETAAAMGAAIADQAIATQMTRLHGNGNAD